MLKAATAAFLLWENRLDAAVGVLVGVSALSCAAIALDPTGCGFPPGSRSGGYARVGAPNGPPLCDGDAVLAVAKAHNEDRRVGLLAPQWLAFGFGSSVFTSWRTPASFDASRRRRDRRADSPWKRTAATPRPPRG